MSEIIDNTIDMASKMTPPGLIKHYLSMVINLPTFYWKIIVFLIILLWISSFYRNSATKTTYRFPKGPLDHKTLVALDNYQYSSSTYTPLDNFMNDYYWTPISQFIPATIAPNLITLTGVSLLLPVSIYNLYINPTLSNPVSESLYILNFFALFVYQTMDALDGKQARKTGASSPLGQLFDHGVDACVVTLVGISVANALCIGPVLFFILMINLQLPFFTAQWGERHTHVLRSSVGGIGVTEGQFLAMFIILAPGIFGNDFWTLPISTWAPPALNIVFESIIMILQSCQHHLLDFVNLLAEIFFKYSPQTINATETLATEAISTSTCFCKNMLHSIIQYTFDSIISLNFSALLSLSNGHLLLLSYCTTSILLTGVTVISVFAKHGLNIKMQILAFLQLTPIIIFISLCLLWTTQPSYQYHPMLTPFIIGLPFSHLTAQMIVAAMTRTNFSIFQFILLPLALLIVPTHILSIAEKYGVKLPVCEWIDVLTLISNPKNTYYFVAFISIFVPLRWASNTIHQISKHLNIFALQLGKRFPEVRKDE